MTRLKMFGFLAGLCIVSVAGSADAAVLHLGDYRLHNHPDGSARPPLYGMRLDELFNVTAEKDTYTFDFDDPRSDMRMTLTATSVHIYGQAWGGRDIGNVYAVEPTTGLYTIEFMYALGLRGADGDDDMIVDAPNRSNEGYIVPPHVNVKIPLVDERGMTPADHFYSLRLGDEDNDLGHRGFPGISGWGWLTHQPSDLPHIADSDFLFTAELIPSPGSFGLVFVGMLAAGRRRR